MHKKHFFGFFVKKYFFGLLLNFQKIFDFLKCDYFLAFYTHFCWNIQNPMFSKFEGTNNTQKINWGFFPKIFFFYFVSYFYKIILHFSVTLLSCVVEEFLSKKLESIVVVLGLLQQRCFDFTTTMLYIVMKASLLLNETGHITPIFFSNWGQKQRKNIFFITFASKVGILKIFHFLKLFLS